MKKIIIFTLIIQVAFTSIAAKVDTVAIYSNAMHHSYNCIVIKPGNYKRKSNSFSVVYLLHGYSGRYDNWIIKVPKLKLLADKNNIIIVCPDGGFSSWYFDSPIDSTSKYETYIATEVVNFIDKNYRTILNKNNRAITGLSMGGHGALFLALRHPDIFCAAGSMSGGVDLSQSKNKFDIIKRIGDTILNANNWHDYSVVNLIEKYTTTPVKIIFDCGIKDIFINGNRLLHKKMLELNIAHTYIERPGEHNWNYWANAIEYELLYFKNVMQ